MKPASPAAQAHGSLDFWRPHRWIGPATVIAALLLLSLHQVVSGAVRHAQAQREAGVDGSHCEALADEARRELCLSRLKVRTLAVDEH